MARKIVVVLPGEADLVLSEVLAHDEEQLQQHLTEYPEMIPVEEFGWSGPMMVVGRESSLPSGAPDLVGVGPEGEILIAEFKTGPQNPDFRAAVAQAIDYGADLWGMSFDEFEEAVAVRYFNSQYCPADSPSSRADFARGCRRSDVGGHRGTRKSRASSVTGSRLRCAMGSSISPWSPSDSPSPWRARRSISTPPGSALACTSSS